MAETALDLITNALLDLGVLADEETPTASQAAGGLRKLNNMIDAWNIEDLLVYGSIENVFPLVANKDTYTIGAGGDFNIDRPDNIFAAYLRDPSQGFDFDLYMYNPQEYADVTIKGLTTTMPQGVFFDYAFPYVNATLWPVPSTTQYQLTFWTQGIIGNLALNDNIELAPGYKRALESNLAIELAPSYGKQIAPATVEIASKSKSDLKLKNFSLNELKIDTRMTGRAYNQYTGT